MRVCRNHRVLNKTAKNYIHNKELYTQLKIVPTEGPISFRLQKLTRIHSNQAPIDLDYFKVTFGIFLHKTTRIL